MGKTNQPLGIWVAEEWMSHPAILALREAGHDVAAIGDPMPPEPDLILHPAAHGWREADFDFKQALPAALKWARARKKEAKNGATSDMSEVRVRDAEAR